MAAMEAGIVGLIKRLAGTSFEAEPTEYASRTLELINTLSAVSAPHTGPPGTRVGGSPVASNEPALITPEHAAIVAHVAHTLLTSQSTYLSALGLALVAMPSFFDTLPTAAKRFFEEDGGKAAVRGYDTATAFAHLPGATADQVSSAKRVQAGFRMFVAASIDHVAAGRLEAKLLHRSMIDRIVGILGGPEADAALHSFAILKVALLHLPAQCAACGVLDTLLQRHVTQECVVPLSGGEIASTTMNAITAQGITYLDVTDFSAAFLPYADVFSELDERLLRSRRLLCSLASAWPGLFALSTTAPFGLMELVRVIRLPGQTARRVLLVELFISMLRAAAPHRGISADGPWAPFLQRTESAGSNPSLRTMSAFGRSRATTSAVNDFDLVDDEQEVRPELSQPTIGFDDELTEHTSTASVVAPPVSTRHTRDVFVATFLCLLNTIGLPEALMDVIRTTSSSTDTALPESAALLLQHILVLEHSHLPQATVDELHAKLDVVVADAALAKDPFIGALTTKLFHMVAFAPNQTADSAASLGGFGGSLKAAAVANATASPTTTVATARHLIKASLVLEVQEHDRWNYAVVIDMCRNHLRIPAAFAVAREQKFFSRLLTFFQPTVGDGKPSVFAQLARRSTVSSCSVAGLALLDSLLSSPDGAALLLEHSVPQRLTTFLCECVVSPKGHVSLVTRMAGDYLRWTAVLTQSHVGISLLHSAAFFDHLTQSFKQPSGNPEVMRAIVNHLHLGSIPQIGVDPKVKAFVAFVMGSAETLLRLATITRLDRFVRADLWASPGWVVDVLLAIVLQGSSEGRRRRRGGGVVSRALSLLRYLATVSPEARSVVATPSNLESMLTVFEWDDAPTTPLLIDLFVAVLPDPKAVRVLRDGGWIARALRQWESAPRCAASSPTRSRVGSTALSRDVPRWIDYVHMADVAFSAAEESANGNADLRRHSSPDGGDPSSSSDSSASSEESPARDADTREGNALAGEEPWHLCGQLAATPEGAEAMAESSLYRTIAAALQGDRAATVPRHVPDTGLLRAAASAVGQMASQDNAHPLLVSDAMLHRLAELTSHSAPLVRSTAITSLSLVARCQLGRERLASVLGFTSCEHSRVYSVSQFSICTSYAYPSKRSVRWLSIESGVDPMSEEDLDLPNALESGPGELDTTEQDILRVLHHGATATLQAAKNAALPKLLDLRRRAPHVFATPAMQKRATHFLATQSLEEQDRRVIALVFAPGATTADVHRMMSSRR